MKHKLNILLIISAIILIVSQSCKKEEAIVLGTPKNPITNDKSVVPTTNISIDDFGWLVFTDGDVFRSTIDELQAQNELYDESYDEVFSSITSESTDYEIDSIVEASGYIENTPILDFEASFSNYSSLRYSLESQQNDWLFAHEDDEDLSFATYPSHYLDGAALATVFNQYGEVQVNGLVYFTRSDGKAIAIDRDEISTNNIGSIRDLIYSPSFNPSNYNSENVTDDELISKFYTGMTNSKSKLGNTKGGIVVIISIPVGSLVISALHDVVQWLNDGNDPNECLYDHNIQLQDYLLSETNKLTCDSRWRAILVYGQQSYGKIKYYRKNTNDDWKNIKHKMGIYAVTPWLNRDSDCSTSSDGVNYNPGNNTAHIQTRTEVDKGVWVSGFHQTKIASNERFCNFYDGTTFKVRHYNIW